MEQHVTSLHVVTIDYNEIISVSHNELIESWVRKVIEVQEKLIEDNEPLLVPLTTRIEDIDGDGNASSAKRKKKNPCDSDQSDLR